ncbi:hypothetical protein K458DRAFT_389462 [Lentithecium fluviatile CBS 122367]|uniref:Uncharacterized protein n=1 Tax=Lentithecium fluviatile CBS 122367 TaxID=1168545 RepID=A0A6G1J163_9PLEO|nr:hypothetical protein K458DRAFT_389462 [Lentithecium fluviatile CBS 122367]
MNERLIVPEKLGQTERFGDCIPVNKVDARTVVKTGDCVRLAEAEAVKLIDTVTSHARIVMEFIGSVNGDTCEDLLFTDEIGAYGPYEDETAFNQGIVTAVKGTLTVYFMCGPGPWPSPYIWPGWAGSGPWAI